MDETSSNCSTEHFYSVPNKQEEAPDSVNIAQVSGPKLHKKNEHTNNCKCSPLDINSVNVCNEIGCHGLPTQVKIHRERGMFLENTLSRERSKPKRRKIERHYQDCQARTECHHNRENLDTPRDNRNSCVVIDSENNETSEDGVTNKDAFGIVEKNEASQSLLAELSSDQLQRIQNFIESIKPESFSNRRQNGDVQKVFSSTPKTTKIVAPKQILISPIPTGVNSSIDTVPTNHGVDNKSMIKISCNNTSQQDEASIMGYVDSLVASEEDAIHKEVGERLARTFRCQESAYDSFTSVFNEGHDVFHEDIVMDNSVEIVGFTPAPPVYNLVDTIDEVVVLSNNDSDVEVIEGPCTSAGVRNNRKRKAVIPKKSVKRGRKNITPIDNNEAFVNNVAVSNLPAKPAANQNSGLGIRECPICLDQLHNKEISSTICGHVFCTACIRAAVKSSKTCPNCRTKLTLKKIHPLFL